MKQDDYLEDGIPNFPVPSSNFFYGHRAQAQNGNDDYKPDRVQGCEYQGVINLRARLDGPPKLEFVGLIVTLAMGK